MKKFITTLKNIWSIEELRNRILTTLFIILVFRIGSHITLPGVDPSKLTDLTGGNGLLGLLDTLVGGAFSNASVMALGIMPYISASIAVQLLGLALPYFSKLQKEGESGRKKLNQITRWLTIAVTITQGFAYLKSTIPTDAIFVTQGLFYVSGVILLVAGTMMCLWLGERITEKGIGNGISMIIMIGIVSRFPGAIIGEGRARVADGQPLYFILELVVMFLVVIFAVGLTQAVRRVPVQYAKQIVGNKTVTGQRQYLPLKVNISGVMPIIFAQAIMFLPTLFSYTSFESGQGIAKIFADPRDAWHMVIYAVIVIAFTFLYTALIFNPKQIAEDLKRNNGFIPGVKPGQPTADYIGAVMDRITLPGAILLAIVGIMPGFAQRLNITQGFASFFGGTSLLIMVGVILDTLQQIETQLLMRQYDGLMKSGRIQGRQSMTSSPI